MNADELRLDAKMLSALPRLCFFACSTYHIRILWGRLVTCGRLAIDPAIFWNRTWRITNPPQVTNLPHTISTNLRRSRPVFIRVYRRPRSFRLI
jgi:hypothetical protein